MEFSSGDVVLLFSENHSDSLITITLLQSWARFEPPKTTIKRMLLPESQKANVDKSSSVMDKQNFSPCSEEAAVARQKVHVTPSSSLPHFGNKGEH